MCYKSFWNFDCTCIFMIYKATVICNLEKSIVVIFKVKKKNNNQDVFLKMF